MASSQEDTSSALTDPILPSTPTDTTQTTERKEQGEELPYILLSDGHKRYPKGKDPMLRYKKPYWWPYKTFVKDRWIGRELLEVVSTEFRDRSVEYYKHALESGVTRVNGVVASPSFVLRNGDRIDNTVHRHEPPITNDPILVLHMDKEREFVVISKPGSIPVHAAGRYFRHTVLELMQSDYNIKCYSVNRLDRLTSGLMILALTGPASRDLSMEFAEGRVRKEYVARVTGKFPEGRVVVDKPLLTVDRQMGLVIVTPEGKEAKTIFKRLSYDEKRDQSVIHCRPLTGRTHQIRVHLQYLGFPIANDPLYAQPAVWGEGRGKGGVDLNPSPEALSSAEILKARQKEEDGVADVASRVRKIDLNDREYSNIDAGSPILLSQQAKDIIAKLRKARDEAEDWIKSVDEYSIPKTTSTPPALSHDEVVADDRWKEVIFTMKAAQDKLNENSPSSAEASGTTTPASTEDPSTPSNSTKRPKAHPKVGKYSRKDDVPEPLEDFQSSLRKPAHLPPGFCEECFVPVPEDPDPEKLFIFLHALRYTTPRLGAWATPLPRWAGTGWGGDWRGWSDDPVPPPFPDEEDGEEGELVGSKEKGEGDVQHAGV